MTYETIIVEKEEPIGVIKLNRPPVNPVSVQSYHKLYNAIDELDKDDTIGAILITGAGDKAYASGLTIEMDCFSIAFK
jgi:enoyl-CoA hydratase/carnithine racemase